MSERPSRCPTCGSNQPGMCRIPTGEMHHHGLSRHCCSDPWHSPAQAAAEPAVLEPTKRTRCHADEDGECTWKDCPQLRDGEPMKSGRHCPLDLEDYEIEAQQSAEPPGESRMEKGAGDVEMDVGKPNAHSDLSADNLSNAIRCTEVDSTSAVAQPEKAMTAERKVFEEWYHTTYPDAGIPEWWDAENCYFYEICQTCWEVWQAASARLAEQEQTIAELRQSVVLVLRELKQAEARVERLEKALSDVFILALERELKARYDVCEDFAATPSSILLAVLNAVAAARVEAEEPAGEPERE